MASRSFIVIIGCLLPAFLGAGEKLEDLIYNRCIDCHDDALKKGGLSFDALEFEIDANNADTWKTVLVQIDHGFMPPAEEEQPEPAEREAALLDLESQLIAWQATQTGHPAVLRRLNRTEYKNTIRDLLHLNLDASDPTTEFPADQRHHGFASDGETLVTSSFLLRQYLEAAEKVIAEAVHFEPKPEVQRWDMKPPFDRTTGYQTGGEARYFQKRKEPQPYQTISQRIRGIPKMGYHPLDDLSQGVAQSGWYRIRIQAEAKHRYALDQSKFTRFPSQWDETEPLRLALFTGTLEGIDPGNKEALTYASTHEQSGERLLATWDLPDDELAWHECEVWLSAGHFPRLGFPNGPSDSNYRLLNYFKDNKDDLLDQEGLARVAEEKGSNNLFMWFESPRIQIHQIEVEGPLNETWPPPSHVAIFGKAPYTSARAEQVLIDFAGKAWRRPVTAIEVAPILELVRLSEGNGLSAEDAIQEGLKAVLCAPEFLYREEKGDALTDYEIATRLSYFLWASTPDKTLMSLAEAGRLKNKETLRNQSERLLADSRSDAFVTEFLDGWLRMRQLGSMAPDVRRFSVYYHDDLEAAMRKETELFFHYLLRTNGRIRDFLDSSYTFANKELAGLYGVTPEVVAESQIESISGLDTRLIRQDGVGHAPSMNFAKIPLQDRRRGGLLGQASVLTLTANGVDTSPVLRGVWLLENILGTPPPPPPPDVPAIEPDIRGAKTIREQLQKHRESTTCRGCHAHIDPPGFALENFDAIGAWRGNYKLGNASPAVDATGSFAGQEFADVVEFKELLVSREEAFARTLVEKLFLHALGREMEVSDRPHVRKIVEEAAAKGYRLQDLVLGCVGSELFVRK